MLPHDQGFHVVELNPSGQTLILINIKTLIAHSAGFEPARAEPNRFLVYRLNHSATSAAVHWCPKGAPEVKLEMIPFLHTKETVAWKL